MRQLLRFKSTVCYSEQENENKKYRIKKKKKEISERQHTPGQDSVFEYSWIRSVCIMGSGATCVCVCADKHRHTHTQRETQRRRRRQRTVNSNLFTTPPGLHLLPLFEKSAWKHVCVIWHVLSNGNNPPVFFFLSARRSFQGKINRMLLSHRV